MIVTVSPGTLVDKAEPVTSMSSGIILLYSALSKVQGVLRQCGTINPLQGRDILRLRDAADRSRGIELERPNKGILYTNKLSKYIL